jgi:sugar phosphate isomerase/epimerase
MLARRQFLGSMVGLPWISSSIHAANPEANFAVSSWSFHNYFPHTRYGKPEFKVEDWTIEKVVDTIKAGLGITNIEMSSAHFASLDPKYLVDLAAFMKDRGCKFIHLSDNMRGVNLAKSDAGQRAADLKRFEELIEIARRFNIPTMRVNTGTPETKDWDLAVTISQYQHLAKFAAERGVEIIIENHFGISADPKQVAKIIEAVGKNISSCPDFGLFKSEAERAEGLPLMFKHAKKICSAKFHGILDDGKTKDFDLKQCYQTMKDSQYPGWVSFEYEGPLDPLVQLQRMKKLATEWLS